ncbi:ATP-binding protein [Polyangium spumosum]|uniref:histidine kinase n=1 Tax=Polyangium spumosum TaxID=889282 RepID=A0A6N7PNR2_9BACT|nr:ATP-binding protein [Polyangium spumosum]MRG93317.1 PAS domain-containing protein [Polyangium spumosum]
MRGGSVPDPDKLVVLNAVLRVAARHPSLLAPVAFEELRRALAAHIPFASLVVLLPDDDAHQRFYTDTDNPKLPRDIRFGGRIPSDPAFCQRVYVEVRPFVCDDASLGNAMDRAGFEAGYRSYVGVPVRSSGDARVFAALVMSFPQPGEAGRAPIDLLEEIADIIGVGVERSLRSARERRLAMILDTSCDAMLAWDRSGRVTDANRAALTLTGLSREELIGRRIGTLLDPEPDPAVGLPQPDARLVLVARLPDGEARRLPVAATVTAVEDDPLVACHALLRDLSAWEANEREVVAHLARIRELEEQHRTLLDNAPLVIFRLDPRSLELVYLNHCAERLLGVPLDEALVTPGFLCGLHVDPEGTAAYEEAVLRARAGMRSSPYEARLARRGAHAITARGTIYPLVGKGGEVVAIEGLFMDVSVEHAARTRLIQADRLSTLGTLAAGVAHEINNPAAFILLGLDMMARMLDGPGVDLGPTVSEQVRSMLGELRDSTRRIVDIVRDLRMFARAPGGPRRIAVDVNRTVESALSLTRGQIIERARIVRDLGDVPPVLIDEGRLGQVLVNLLVNAAQAIPRNAPGEPAVTVTTRSEDPRTVEIEVRDTGLGIAQEIRDRIWDPFFTTKEPGAGTGLGLSISREIIERSGGRIYVESPIEGEELPHGGARFVIVLPAAGRGDSSIPPMPSTPPRSIRSGVRVLVVEDEAPLARALAEEIGRVHEVTLASGAQGALSALGSQRFDVILCDLRMPGMSGEAFYEKVAADRPDVAKRFVFMTGVGFGADVERFLAESGRPVLEKPFSAEDALSVIQKVVTRLGRAANPGR